MSDIFGDTTRAELQQEIDRLRADLAQRTAERDSLAAEVATLKAQRDELRRWHCYERADPREEAKRRGWDCFPKPPTYSKALKICKEAKKAREARP